MCFSLNLNFAILECRNFAAFYFGVFPVFYYSIYQAFDGPTEFSRVFNFAILSYSRNSRKFDATRKICFTVSDRLQTVYFDF